MTIHSVGRKLSWANIQGVVKILFQVRYQNIVCNLCKYNIKKEVGVQGVLKPVESNYCNMGLNPKFKLSDGAAISKYWV